MIFINLTNSQKEYIKTIYLLNKKSNRIRVTDIANSMNITKPSVNKALNILKELNLIEYSSYSQILLTNEAVTIAKSLLKKEDIVEVFLTSILGVENSQAKVDAVNIKNSLSEETENKLYKYIEDLLNINNKSCKCKYSELKDECKKCKSNIIRKEIANNIKWKQIVKGEK